MRDSASIHRTLTKITLDFHRQMEARREAARHYEMCEREQQFQFPFSGKLGTFPAETTFKIPFDTIFLGDAGVARDSQLEYPTVRFGCHITSAPKGTLHYAHVAAWIQDDGFNFTGAKVTLGMHNPSIALLGAGAAPALEYHGVLHCTFQGFGVPLDNDGDGAGGGEVGQ